MAVKMSKRQARIYRKEIYDKAMGINQPSTFAKMAIANGTSVRIGSYCFKSKKR